MGSVAESAWNTISNGGLRLAASRRAGTALREDRKGSRLMRGLPLWSDPDSPVNLGPVAYVPHVLNESPMFRHQPAAGSPPTHRDPSHVTKRTLYLGLDGMRDPGGCRSPASALMPPAR